MSKRESKPIKERIIEESWNLFHEKGFDNTTVDDILKKADIAKGSFYYYFSGKAELLTTLSDILDKKYKSLYKEISPDMNCFDKLMYLNYEVHKMMEERIDVNVLASMYADQLTTKGERHLLDANRYYYKLITEIVEEGQKKGELTKEKTVGEIVHLYTLCERALVSDWCLNKASYSLAEYSRQTMPELLSALRL